MLAVVASVRLRSGLPVTVPAIGSCGIVRRGRVGVQLGCLRSGSRRSGGYGGYE